jgi:hypothetical protein
MGWTVKLIGKIILRLCGGQGIAPLDELLDRTSCQGKLDGWRRPLYTVGHLFQNLVGGAAQVAVAARGKFLGVFVPDCFRQCIPFLQAIEGFYALGDYRIIQLFGQFSRPLPDHPDLGFRLAGGADRLPG